MNIDPSGYALSARISDADVIDFTNSKINLEPATITKFRDRADSLIRRLTRYIEENDDYDLVAAFHSGSLAKGTAIQGAGDLDIALYVQAGAVPQQDDQLVSWLIDRLHQVLPTFTDEQFKPEDHCVKLLYADHPSVDVVPVLYKGKDNWVGELVKKRSGRRVMTSIPMHLDFIARREADYPGYAQLVRIVKKWVGLQKQADDDFRFKSFMAELLVAHLCDTASLNPADVTNALQQLFGYIVSSKLGDVIIFKDNYRAASVTVDNKPIRIYDPVNPDNNITTTYTSAHLIKILTASQKAYDAVSVAPFEITKQEAARDWQEILGPTFRG